MVVTVQYMCMCCMCANGWRGSACCIGLTIWTRSGVVWSGSGHFGPYAGGVKFIMPCFGHC